MGAGKYNRLITPQRKTVTYGTRNEQVETWTDLTPIWAEKKTTGGGEFYAAQKVNSETSALFTMRYHPSLSKEMRIKDGRTVYEVLDAVDVDGQRVETAMSCREVT